VPPSRYFWLGLTAAGLGMALFFSLSQIGVGGALFLTLAGLFIYRYVRNRPQQIQGLFVRRVSKIPEVRLITIQDRQITVVVDRPVGATLRPDQCPSGNLQPEALLRPAHDRIHPACGHGRADAQAPG